MVMELKEKDNETLVVISLDMNEKGESGETISIPLESVMKEELHRVLLACSRSQFKVSAGRGRLCHKNVERCWGNSPSPSPSHVQRRL
ncbi:hypothetical protein AAFF_G00124580 [Aldrovandia affinis]|uniref:Uncharacterized protein n=1 Tax=Aldrovandia affinis TaxID=143900 RepID=A0AAD7RU79_9TELE|nr:hypothetical protein AAFF_G00124580 [Aldrovandia affinis]